ncbi:MAG: sensor histidine kinase [Ktedonobacterales bacterium]
MKRSGEARGRTSFGTPPATLLWTVYLIWLLLLVSRVRSLMHLPAGLHTSTTLLGVALFVVLYIWTSWDTARDVAQPQPAVARSAWRVWPPIAILTLLSVLLTLFAGADWLGLFIFTTAIAGGRLSTVKGLMALIALICLAAGTAWLMHGGQATLWPTLAEMPFVGITVISAMQSIKITITANRELRDAREEIARLAITEERLRFARDLHDLLGHTLSLIALKSELAGRLVRAAPERAVAEIGDVEHAARASLQEVREAVAGYRHPVLTTELHAAEEILSAAGISFTLFGTVPVLPAGVEAALSWTIREGVTNVIRHSHANHCIISLTLHADYVAIEVCDDGRADLSSSSSPTQHHVGSGLRGLAERVHALGGRVEAGSGAGGGFRLAVSLPVMVAASADEAAPERSPSDGERAKVS